MRPCGGPPCSHRSSAHLCQYFAVVSFCGVSSWGLSCSLRGVDLAAHDPRVLAELPSPREPVLLEELGGRAEQEPTLSLPSGGNLGDCLDETAAGGGDLGERALQPSPRDSAAAMALVYEDAGDPPARTGRR